MTRRNCCQHMHNFLFMLCSGPCCSRQEGIFLLHFPSSSRKYLSVCCFAWSLIPSPCGSRVIRANRISTPNFHIVAYYPTVALKPSCSHACRRKILPYFLLQTRCRPAARCLFNYYQLWQLPSAIHIQHFFPASLRLLGRVEAQIV